MNEIKTMKLADLKPAPYNPRKISKSALAGLAASIKRFGLVQPIIMNKRSGFVIGGHQRIKALQKLGETEGYVLVVDIPESEEKAMNVTLNNPEIEGEFTDGLDDLLKDIQLQIGDSDFQELNLNALLDEIEGAEQDEIPEPPKKPITKKGDIWILGDHKVFCGDSTDSESVCSKLPSGCTLTFTSPPYWVGMSYEYQKSIAEIDQFIKGTVKTICSMMNKDQSRVIINTGTGNGRQFSKKVETLLLIDKWTNELRSNGWLLRHLRMWTKSGGMPAPIPPKNDFIDQHSEFIGTFYHAAGKNRGQNRTGEQWNQQGYFDDIPGDASAGGVHIAAFPIELPRRFLTLYTLKGETVFDPFGGAGTTLIAAEQLGRKCVTIELSPAYVDVIVDLWQKLTGKKAKRKSVAN